MAKFVCFDWVRPAEGPAGKLDGVVGGGRGQCGGAAGDLGGRGNSLTFTLRIIEEVGVTNVVILITQIQR